MDRRLLVGILVATLGFCRSAHSQDYPTTGLVFNTRENSSITYICELNANKRLECEFNQTSVRKAAKPEEWVEELKKAEKSYVEDVKKPRDDCKLFTATQEVLLGRKKPEDITNGPTWADKAEFIKKMRSMSEAEKKDLSGDIAPLVEYCNAPTKENYINLWRSGFDKQLRTCSVGSNAFKQIFKWVVDDSKEGGAWIVDSTASGPCGVVQLSRFEPVRTETTKLTFWRYIARKAITNPNGNILLAKCKDFDESEYIYDWKNERNNKLNCTYVEFAPF